MFQLTERLEIFEEITNGPKHFSCACEALLFSIFATLLSPSLTMKSRLVLLLSRPPRGSHGCLHSARIGEEENISPDLVESLHPQFHKIKPSHISSRNNKTKGFESECHQSVPIPHAQKMKIEMHSAYPTVAAAHTITTHTTSHMTIKSE